MRGLEHSSQITTRSAAFKLPQFSVLNRLPVPLKRYRDILRYSIAVLSVTFLPYIEFIDEGYFNRDFNRKLVSSDQIVGLPMIEMVRIRKCVVLGPQLVKFASYLILRLEQTF